MVPKEALVDGFEVYTNWRKFGPLVDTKCNTKQEQNLAKIMNKNSKQTMPKALVSFTQARNWWLKTFQNMVKVRGRNQAHSLEFYFSTTT